MNRTPIAFAASILLLAGCGGSGSKSDGADGVHQTSLGIGSVTYSGKIVPAAVFSSNGVTVASMAGASFTSVSLSPAQIQQNSLIAFAEDGQIFTVQNGVLNQVTHGLLDCDWPAISKTGVIAFTGFDVVTGSLQIYSCNIDGSGLRRITSSNSLKYTPSWSPSGSKLAFGNSSTSKIETVNADGSNEATLNITGTDLNSSTLYYPAWSPDGSKIAFTGYNNAASHYWIWTVANSGGVATPLTTGSSTDYEVPSWSPDGTEIAYVINPNAGSVRIDAGLFPSGLDRVLATPASGSSYFKPSFSPDGKALAFAVDNGSYTYIATQLIGQNGALSTVAAPAAAGLALKSPTWSPFFGNKRFIGTGGQMSSAAGFLWAQQGDGFGSFASFAATTPSKMTITQQAPGTAGGPAVYTVKADNITKIVYSNSYYGALTSITPTGTTPSALVSISTTSGQVGVVAPLALRENATRSQAKELAYDGIFTAIYDAHGKNLAPTGATHIELNENTGALASWR